MKDRLTGDVLPPVPPMYRDGEESAIIYSSLVPLPDEHQEQSYFPPGFKSSDVVLEPLLAKYAERHKDEPNFFFGLNDPPYKRFAKRGSYFAKAAAALRECAKAEADNNPSRHLGRLLAAQIGEDDESDDGMNRQGFFAMMRNGIVYKAGIAKADFYPYDEIKLIEDSGIFNKFATPEVEDPLVDYDDIAPGMWDLLCEYQMLRQPVICGIAAGHPFAARQITDKAAYLALLIDAAVAEGGFDATAAARIDYLAREFGVGFNDVERMFRTAADNAKDNYAKRVRDFSRKHLDNSNFSQRGTSSSNVEMDPVFVFDALELAIGPDGEERRKEMVRFFKAKKRGFLSDHQEFVEHYIDYLKLRKQAEQKLKAALECLPRKNETIAVAVKMQDFNRRLNLEIIKTGVNLNE